MRPALLPLVLLAAGAAGVAACGSSTDDRPATFSYISTAILVPNCATSGCHSKIASTGGVVLDNRLDAYTSLVGADARGNFVIPGDPDRSQLMKLLRGDQIWRMPPDGPLPEADILLIERWILDGAKDD
jgi:cytochrome c